MNIKKRLYFVSISLKQFLKHFVSMFEDKLACSEHLENLILQCEVERDNLEVPDWMRYIDDGLTQRVSRLISV